LPIICEYFLAQLVERSIVVVPDVSERLAQFSADLCQRVSIEKVEAQGLALISRQPIHDFL
jgi:hypothetical protein